MRFLCLVFVLCFSIAANASTYYVDYIGGSDAAAGTATGTAWKHCPMDAAATGNAATSLVPGDIIDFKGGSFYVISSTIVPTNGVTYQSTWGSGKAVFTDYNSNPGHTAFTSPSVLRNVIFRNLTFTNLGGITNFSYFPTNAYDGVGVAENDGFAFVATGSIASNILFDACSFYKLGYWSNNIPMNAGSINGSGILMSPSTAGTFSGITVTNCHFEDMAKAIAIISGPVATNIVITHCSFRGSFNWVVNLAFRGTSAYMDYVTIDHCDFSDYYGLCNWIGYGGAPHIDGIYYFGSYDAGSDTYRYGTNVFFHDNYFSATGNGYAASIGDGTTSPMTIDRGVSANVYNNVWSNAAFANGCISLGDGANNSFGTFINVFNNTMIDPSGALMVTMGSSLSGFFPDRVNIQNNLVKQSASSATLLRMSGQSTTNYNYTYVTNNWYINNNCWVYTTNLNFSIYVFMNPWWNGSGFSDQLGNFDGLMHSDLKFELQSIFTTDALLVGVQPATNSILIGAGANLSSYTWLPGLTTDYVGNARPAVNPWTIGAFQGADTNLYCTLIVVNGTGSGPYVTNSVVPISTNPTNFTSWTGAVSNSALSSTFVTMSNLTITVTANHSTPATNNGILISGSITGTIFTQ